MLAENSGINVIGSGFNALGFQAKYKKETGIKLIVIGQVGLPVNSNNIYELFDQAVSFGVDMLQIHGEWCDRLVVQNRFDDIVKILDYIPRQALTAGMGAHMIDSQIICDENKILPDCMVTMHQSNYWLLTRLKTGWSMNR